MGTPGQPAQPSQESGWTTTEPVPPAQPGQEWTTIGPDPLAQTRQEWTITESGLPAQPGHEWGTKQPGPQVQTGRECGLAAIEPDISTPPADTFPLNDDMLFTPPPSPQATFRQPAKLTEVPPNRRKYAISVASSVYHYRFENGRRYHARCENEYPFPNDEKEQDRLDLIHHLHCLILDGKLFVSPIGNSSKRVLDIGTGTGIWAIDFADEFPSAEVVGTDLSPIQPEWVPPNLTFIIDDCEADWTFPHKFDFIHARTLGGSITNLPRLLRQAYDNLEPGGWLEMQEYETTSKSDDNSFPPDSALLRWINNLNRAAEKLGRPLNIAAELRGQLVVAGFANVEDHVYKVPMTPWAKNKKLKDQGRFNQIAMLDSLQSYTLHLFTRVLDYSASEAEVYLVDVRKELMDPRIHMYSTYHFVCGQKPL